MKARFVGNPSSDGDGPERLTVFGGEFVKGEWREVSDDVAARLSTNNHFEVGEPAPEPAPEPAAEVVAEDAFNGADPLAFDHDQNGQPGGSKKRRKRKS